jgi:hypothetical protein
MIRGRAAAGEALDSPPLAARPQVVSALSRMTAAVGATGVVVVLCASLGGGMFRVAADAAVSAGGPVTSGPGRSDAVAGLSASDPVPVDLRDISAPRVTLASIAPPVAPVALPKPVIARITAAVVPTIAPAPTVPPAPGSVEAIITEVFGPYARQAIGVARCESHLNPGSISSNRANWGLFQINTSHRRQVEQMGYRWEDLLDARVNSLVAKSIFDGQGWRPWGCRAAAR